jgi:hypothetical protein
MHRADGHPSELKACDVESVVWQPSGATSLSHVPVHSCY